MRVPFRPIARRLTQTLHPQPIMDLSAVQPFFNCLETGAVERGVLLTVNHYHAPDFRPWWYVLPISALFPVEIHWLVTAAWRDPRWITGFTGWLFPRLANLFDFTAMPAMPPEPAETEQRVTAVREVLHFVRTSAHPAIGISPEGRDQPGGVLGDLPSGVGRFMLLINQSCPNILPVGVWKEEGIIYFNFGKPYRLEITPGITVEEKDRQAGDAVMRKIAELLPVRLRGMYK